MPSWTDVVVDLREERTPGPGTRIARRSWRTKGNELRVEVAPCRSTSSSPRTRTTGLGNAGTAADARRDGADAAGHIRARLVQQVIGQLEDTFTQVVENGDAAAGAGRRRTDHPGRPRPGMGDLGSAEVSGSDARIPMSASRATVGRLVRPRQRRHRFGDGREMTGRRSCSCRPGCSGLCSSSDCRSS